MSADADHSECCGILHDGGVIGPGDPEGCVLAMGHDGPHEFVAEDGRRWQWETDLECSCAHCLRYEGDYCTVYWPKAYSETPDSTATLSREQTP